MSCVLLKFLVTHTSRKWLGRDNIFYSVIYCTCCNYWASLTLKFVG